MKKSVCRSHSEISKPCFQSKRLGVAASEMAVCLPLFVLVVFGGIETADMVFLKETLKSASYEGGRAGAKWNSTNQQVSDRISTLLDARHVSGATFVIDLPGNAADVSQLNRGDIFTVKIRAPADSNTVGPLRMYAGRVLSSSTLMVRE